MQAGRPIWGWVEKIKKHAKKELTIQEERGNINLALNEGAVKYARVVELADSLDSGSSVHYARAGSSPASRTKNGASICLLRFFLLEIRCGAVDVLCILYETL